MAECSHDYHSAAHNFKYFYDFCLVWPFEVPPSPFVQSDSDQLGIAFAEYCFQVPANRIGSYEFTAAQLKTIQEAINADGIFGVFGFVLEGTVAVELPAGLWDDGGVGICDF